MINNILVSVIIPIYNKEKYITDCVNSVLDQTYKNLDIILVDDGSTDNSSYTCDKLKSVDKRLRVIHQKNSGASAARQTGVNNASGDYVMFIDADDWIENNCVEVMINELLYSKVDCVCCGYVREHTQRNFETHIFEGDVVFRDEEYINIFYRRFFGLINKELKNPEKIDSLVSCCMKLYPIDALKKGEYLDHKEVGSCEDALLNITALINIKSVKYIDKCYYHYRKDNSNSITYTYRPNLIDQWSILYKYMNEYIVLYKLPDSFNQAMENRIAINTVGYGLTEIDAPNKKFIEKVRTFKKVLNRKEYREAFNNLEFKYIPFKWKIYFYFCKYRAPLVAMMMLIAVKYLRDKKAS